MKWLRDSWLLKARLARCRGAALGVASGLRAEAEGDAMTVRIECSVHG